MVKQPKVQCQACGTENNADEAVCRRCKLSLTAAAPDTTEANIICPRCQKTNNAAAFFCYTCGKYFTDIERPKSATSARKKRRSAKARSVPKAKIIMPGGSELTLTSTPVFIERSDFDSKLPHDILMKISRQHALITYGRGKYYIQDYGRDGKGSTNHTKLNGIDIYGKGRKSLKDGDKIELAGQQKLTLVFRLSQESE